QIAAGSRVAFSLPSREPRSAPKVPAAPATPPPASPGFGRPLPPLSSRFTRVRYRSPGNKDPTRLPSPRRQESLLAERPIPRSVRSVSFQGLAHHSRGGCRHDSKAEHRRVSDLLEEEGPQDGEAAQPGDLLVAGEGAEPRARHPVLQAPRIVRY